MTLFGSLFEKRARKEGPYSLSDAGVTSFLGFDDNSAAGIFVNEHTALNCTTVYACVRVISESISSMPLYLYEREQGGGRRRAEDHPVFPLLSSAPNPEMSSMLWRETSSGHILLWGNAYSYIQRDGRGQIRALWPLDPGRVAVERSKTSREIVYKYEPAGDEPIEVPKVVRASEMLHIPGLSLNGRVGLSVIQANREAIGLTLAAERFGATFFGSGSMPDGVLTHEKPLSKDARTKILTDWENRHQGKRRSALLDGGLEWKQITIPPEDAQFLETRRFQVAEIGRMYRVPLVLLQETEKSTSWGSGIEQIMIGFVTHTLRPYMVRIEQEVSRKLLAPAERPKLFAEHMDAALLRGDLKSRYEAYVSGRNWGWLSANDVRRMENLDPIADESADDYLAPMNMTPAAKLGEVLAQSEPVSANQDAAPAQKSSPREILEPVLLRQLTLLVDRECKAVKKGLENRQMPEFLPWLDDYYRKVADFAAETVGAALESVARARGEANPEHWSAGWCERYAATSRGEIDAAIRGSVDRALDSRSVVSLLLEDWQAAKAARLAEAIFAAEGLRNAA